MKKHFTKKLLLNKKTIAHLANGEMIALQGGGTRTICAFSDDDVSCYKVTCGPRPCNDPAAFSDDDVSCPKVTCCT